MVNLTAHDHRVWRAFLGLEKTLPVERRDYGEWHRGRKKYAVWTIGIEDRAVRSRFNAARAHLSDFLFQPYRRQVHVSVFVCGFLVKHGRLDDDYPVWKLRQHVRSLQRDLPASFDIEIGGVNSFATTPFLEVFDITGGIQKIRGKLARSHNEIRMSPFVPHLTLGLYASDFEPAVVAGSMNSLPTGPRITYHVEVLSLSTYVAWEIAGPLTQVHAVPLGTG